MRPLAAAALLVAAGAAVACAQERPAGAPSPSQEEWSRARAALAQLRARAPGVPHTERVAVTVHAFGHTLEGRGAIAVRPGQALRMIIVGAAGATAFDLWMSRDAWRVEVPAAGLVRRGGIGEAPPGLPVGFFRAWFVDPLAGRLLASDGGTLVLRDREQGTWVMDVRRGEALAITASRRAGEDTQTLDFLGAPSAPARGDRARWSDPRAGLVVEIVVEDVATDPPDPEAFMEPGVEPRGPS